MALGRTIPSSSVKATAFTRPAQGQYLHLVEAVRLAVELVREKRMGVSKS